MEDSIWKKLLNHTKTQIPLSKKGRAWTNMEMGILYRVKHDGHLEHKQLVLPLKFRETVMMAAHESVFGVHLGVAKTLRKVLQRICFAGMVADVHRCCQSSDICQWTIQKGELGKVPFRVMPLIDTLFKRVAIDIAGPI